MLIDMRDPSWPLAPDMDPTWTAVQALVHGGGPYPFLSGSSGLPYSAPFVVLMAPLGLLRRTPALALSQALSLVFVVLTLVAWARSGGLMDERGRSRSGWRRLAEALSLRGLPSWFWPVLLSAPVLSLVRDGQLQMAREFAAISLMLWLARRERWFLAGMAGAIAIGRTPNGVPLIALTALSAWGRPSRLLLGLGGAAVVAVPLVVAAFAWDPRWVTDYGGSLQGYSVSGPLAIGRNLMGPVAITLLPALCTISAVAIGWPRRGRLPDLDRAAAAMAVTMLGAPLPHLYGAVIALPAALRLARRGLTPVPWLVAAVPWLLVLGLTPLLLSPTWRTTFNEANVILAGIFLLSAFPLQRHSPAPRAVEQSNQER